MCRSRSVFFSFFKQRHKIHEILTKDDSAPEKINRKCNKSKGSCKADSHKFTDAENLQRVRELLRGKFARSRRSRRCTRIFALPNAALTQARTLRRLQREFGRHQAFCAAHARETRENFATNSRIFGFSCAENLRDLGAERECLCRQMLHRLKRELCRRQEFYTACAREIQSRFSRAASRNCKKLCNKFEF